MSWKILKKSIAFKNPYRRIDEWMVKNPHNKILPYYFHVANDIVIVFALTKNNEVVVNDQHVINIGKRRLQLPAGYIDKGYTPLSSAKRELKEETGHLAKKWFCLGKSSMGKWSTNDVYYYLALDAYRAGKQELEESEDIKVRLIPLDKFLRLLRAGKIDDNLSVTCALFSLDRLRS